MFWDRVAGVYDIAMKLRNGRANRAFCTQVAAMISSGDAVLECACGTGMITEVLAPRCREVIATDYSDGMLAQARRKCAAFPNVRVEKGDILHLTYADARFDKVVAGNVIHLLDDPGQALQELLRVCRPGGLVILPTYVNQERNGHPSLFVRLADRFGASFRQQFTYAGYQDFIRSCTACETAFTLVDGAMPCAIAVIRKDT